MNRKVKRFFGVGKILPEKVKVAKSCTVLMSELCWKCDKSKKTFIGHELDTENPNCRYCVRLMYKRIYGEDCKSV